MPTSEPVENADRIIREHERDVERVRAGNRRIGRVIIVTSAVGIVVATVLDVIGAAR